MVAIIIDIKTSIDGLAIVFFFFFFFFFIIRDTVFCACSNIDPCMYNIIIRDTVYGSLLGEIPRFSS